MNMQTPPRRFLPALRLSLLPALILLCLLLAGCGKSEEPAERSRPPETVAFSAGAVEAEASDVTIRLAAGETALLAQLPKLRFADLSGSEDAEEIAAWAAAHPEVRVRFTVTLPDGTEVDSDTESYDLSALSGAEAEAAAGRLRLLPALRSVRLGEIGWDSIGRIHETLPDAELHHAFSLYGKDCDLANTSLNFSHIPIEDGGAALRQAMACMGSLNYLDLDSCGLSNAEMEELRRDFPEVKIVWRVWFGENYSVRTDVERILASSPSRGGMLTPDNVEGLYHCHEVKYLDLGHNTELTDLSFLREMPKLEVAVLAMCNWSDAAPLADCRELEYLEMQTTLCTDLSPLSGLTKLRHLNVSHIGVDQPYGEAVFLTDISPLYTLTELERLWIGGYNPVPAEQVEEMQRRAPNCEINTTVGDPTGGRWRYVDYDTENYYYHFPDHFHPRYVLLLEQFAGKGEQSIGPEDYAYSWNDPLY